ncbi:MAG: hypothetical protein HON90_05815 [Halobacteriovoraceae bacterium]|nr:hypothetical protein [Halobacteriovoraceae bacterium]
MLKRLIFLFISFFFTLATWAQNASYVEMGAVALKIQNKNILAITLKNEKKWHTYWKNPGDAGLEVKFKFKAQGKEVKLKDYPWPAPKRYIEQGNMWAYGYSDHYAFFFEVDETLKNKELEVVGQWLVCKDICIPGTKTLTISIDHNLKGKTGPLQSERKLLKAFDYLPQKIKNDHIELFLTKGIKENQLALHFMIEDTDFSSVKKDSNILTPYLRVPLDFKHEEIYFDEANKTIYGRIYIEWDGIFEEPIWNLPKDGKFLKPIDIQFLIQHPRTTKPYIINKVFSQFTLSGDEVLSKRYATLQKLGQKVVSKSQPSNEEPQSILWYILFALLGGLILNLMPCVLPVISLKLFGLIIHSNESKKQILKHNLAYTAGVLISFAVLAITVIILKASGEQIGWGFQLQSPYFVFVMLMIIFIMALNMLGLFEFVTPGGKKLGNQEMKKGLWADFINGVLATILSTPCSAPFLGTALSFAFTTSSLNIFIVFLSIGVGLSAPFILTGFFPAIIRFLPKPGMWMEKLKYFLGFSLILTAVWLADVLFNVINFNIVGIYFNTLIGLTFFAFFFRKFISKNIFFNIVIFALPVFFTYQVGDLILTKSSQLTERTTTRTSDLDWQKWTPEQMGIISDQYTLINFTASWCLTCKVNKKFVLNSSDFKQLVYKKQLKLLEGDWSKYDENITKFLRKFNIVGVPAYFIQKPNGEIISLGETISINKIKENLK